MKQIVVLVLLISFSINGYAQRNNNNVRVNHQIKQMTVSKQRSATKPSIGGTVNGHDWVDLGLSVKWATCNVGANKSEDYGDYYAWGETEIKNMYNWSTYFDNPNHDGRNFKKYYSSNTKIFPEDDVAHVKWSGSWRMPTTEERDELRNKCIWKWSSQNGVKGYRVTSKANGNSIFLPAAGFRNDGVLKNAGSYGYYWCSSIDPVKCYFAETLYFKSSFVDIYAMSRDLGQPVRPVCP